MLSDRDLGLELLYIRLLVLLLLPDPLFLLLLCQQFLQLPDLQLVLGPIVRRLTLRRT